MEAGLFGMGLTVANSQPVQRLFLSIYYKKYCCSKKITKEYYHRSGSVPKPPVEKLARASFGQTSPLGWLKNLQPRENNATQV